MAAFTDSVYWSGKYLILWLFNIHLQALNFAQYFHNSFPDFNQFCFEDSAGGFTWEKTPPLTACIKSCPSGRVGKTKMNQ